MSSLIVYCIKGFNVNNNVNDDSLLSERMERLRSYSLDQPVVMLDSVGTAPLVPSAAVVNNAVIGFTADMSAQNKKDAQNSFLYASQVANRTYDANQQSELWYDLFMKVMQDMGWARIHKNYGYHGVADNSFTMDKVGLNILASVLAAVSVPTVAAKAMLDVAKAAVGAIAKTDKPFKLFKQRSERIGGASFTLGSCSDSNGVVTMALATIDLKSSVTFTNVLFWEWNNSSVQMSRGEAVLTLTEDAYSVIRDEVSRQLGANALAAIAAYSI